MEQIKIDKEELTKELVRIMCINVDEDGNAICNQRYEDQIKSIMETGTEDEQQLLINTVLGFGSFFYNSGKGFEILGEKEARMELIETQTELELLYTQVAGRKLNKIFDRKESEENEEE